MRRRPMPLTDSRRTSIHECSQTAVLRPSIGCQATGRSASTTPLTPRSGVGRRPGDSSRYSISSRTTSFSRITGARRPNGWVQRLLTGLQHDDTDADPSAHRSSVRRNNRRWDRHHHRGDSCRDDGGDRLSRSTITNSEGKPSRRLRRSHPSHSRLPRGALSCAEAGRARRQSTRRYQSRQRCPVPHCLLQDPPSTTCARSCFCSVRPVDCSCSLRSRPSNERRMGRQAHTGR